MGTKSLEQINAQEKSNNYTDDFRLTFISPNEIEEPFKTDINRLVSEMLDMISISFSIYKKHIRVVEQEFFSITFELNLILDYNKYGEQDIHKWFFTIGIESIMEALHRLDNGFLYEQNRSFLQDFFVRQVFIDLGIVDKSLFKAKKFTSKEFNERLKYGISITPDPIQDTNLFKDVEFIKCV